MIEPDYSRGYLRIPLKVWLTVFCRAPFTRRQLQLLAFVIRESWGWQAPDGQVHLWTRPLAIRHFARGTGLSTDHLRRDLDHLISRGVLSLSRKRYRFVADAELWMALRRSAQNRRQITQKSPDLTAASALPAPASKKRERKQRNVILAFEWKFSPGGDNSSSRSSLAASAGARSSAPAAARLVRIVTAFVGTLSPSQDEQLRCWIEQAGVAAVWSALEPALLQNRSDRRLQITAALDNWSAG